MTHIKFSALCLAPNKQSIKVNQNCDEEYYEHQIKSSLLSLDIFLKNFPLSRRPTQPSGMIWTQWGQIQKKANFVQRLFLAPCFWNLDTTTSPGPRLNPDHQPLQSRGLSGQNSGRGGPLPYSGHSRSHAHTQPPLSGCSWQRCSRGYRIPGEAARGGVRPWGSRAGRWETRQDEGPDPHPTSCVPGTPAPWKTSTQNITL